MGFADSFGQGYAIGRSIFATKEVLEQREFKRDANAQMAKAQQEIAEFSATVTFEKEALAAMEKEAYEAGGGTDWDKRIKAQESKVAQSSVDMQAGAIQVFMPMVASGNPVLREQVQPIVANLWKGMGTMNEALAERNRLAEQKRGKLVSEGQAGKGLELQERGLVADISQGQENLEIQWKRAGFEGERLDNEKRRTDLLFEQWNTMSRVEQAKQSLMNVEYIERGRALGWSTEQIAAGLQLPEGVSVEDIMDRTKDYGDKLGPAINQDLKDAAEAERLGDTEMASRFQKSADDKSKVALYLRDMKRRSRDAKLDDHRGWMKKWKDGANKWMYRSEQGLKRVPVGGPMAGAAVGINIAITASEWLNKPSDLEIARKAVRDQGNE